MRIGHGYDVHKLEKDRELILGGVKIDYEFGLLGHSDADVLVHAVMDSILGAAKMGNIGKLFPDDDLRYKDESSLVLLKKVCQIVNEKSYKIVNIDSTVIAQKPKLSLYLNEMEKNIAKVCKIDENMVSVKATTEEGLGFTGKCEGVAAHAVCLIDLI